jgi:Family of unknown function (DUF5829)
MTLQTCEALFMKRLTMIGAIMILFASSVDGQKTEPLPFTVPLNHFFLVVDSAVYADIERSDFLRKEFAPSEQRTTVRTDMTYTGLYFYGVNTYFEFFDIAKETTRRLGNVGIAFGVDASGGLETLQQRIGSDLQVSRRPVTREFRGKPVPWFMMMAPGNVSNVSALSTWVMEYDKRFLGEWNPEADGDNAGVSRKQVLRRYAAVLKDAPARPFLQDVVGLTVALDKNTLASFSNQCWLFGYKSRAEGEATVLEGPDIVFRLIPETQSARGIKEVRLRVTRAPEKQKVYRFGQNSVLTFHGGGTATWTF